MITIYRNDKNGFAALETLLILVIVALIGGTGWYVWHSKQQADKTLNAAQSENTSAFKSTTVKSFADCQKAAGSTVQQSYPEVCVTKSGQRFTQSTSDQSQTPYTTTYSKVPAALQKVILAEITKDVPSCVKDGQLLDANGQADDPRVDYAPSGAAATDIGCDGGSWGLFAKDSSGDWKFLEKTQMAFDCSVLTQYKVAKQLLLLNADAVCFDANNNEVDYNG